MKFPFLALCLGSVFVGQAAWSQEPAATPAPEAQAAEKPLKIPPEYKRKIVKGLEMYCTKTTTLGSRFPKMLCVDETGLRMLTELRASNQQSLSRAQSLCASGRACQIE